MAYNDFNAPAAVLNREIALTRAFFSRLGEMLSNFGVALAKSSSANRRCEEMQALQAKSDAELAQMGLKRDELVQHVFRDAFYI